ncbi:MAG TPA: hypothetical protein VN039_05700 [Nitrospira sp.]|nr:hypothetical protein [Nitrospira sp.]
MSLQAKVLELTSRSQAVQATFAGLNQLHMAAVLQHDSRRETELREEIHATVDALLDVQAEMIQVMEQQ